MTRVRWKRASDGFVESRDGRWRIVPLCCGGTRPEHYALWLDDRKVASYESTQREAKETAEWLHEHGEDEMRLTDRQVEVLDCLTGVKWARPMDVGGRDQSHHQGTLMQLVRRGLVERRLRGSLLNQIRGQELHDRLEKKKRGRHAPRGSYVYRITRAGRAAFEARGAS